MVIATRMIARKMVRLVVVALAVSSENCKISGFSKFVFRSAVVLIKVLFNCDATRAPTVRNPWNSRKAIACCGSSQNRRSVFFIRTYGCRA